MHTYYTQINSLSFYCFAPPVWATYHIYGLFPKLCKHLHFFSVKVLVCSRGNTSKHCFFEANKIYFVCSAIQVNLRQQCVFSLKFWGNNLKFSKLKIHFPPNTQSLWCNGRMDRPGVVGVLNLPMWCASVDSCNFSALISFTAAQ